MTENTAAKAAIKGYAYAIVFSFFWGGGDVGVG